MPGAGDSGRYRRWRASLAPSLLDPRLRSWLSEPGSLTLRCQQHCRRFQVRLLHQGPGRDLIALSSGLCPVREVLLECDGRPVIFAQTTLSTVTRGRLRHWLAGLGSRSLGSLLFAYPGFQRGPIEYCRLDRHDPLYRRVAELLPLETRTLWARRSQHRLGAQQVTVCEVFLSAILDLPA